MSSLKSHDKLWGYLSIIGFVGIIFSGLWWELRGAPLRPGGSMLVLKIIPLLFLLRGIVYLRPRTVRWGLLIACLYLTEALMRIVDPFPVNLWAGIELSFILIFIAAALAYLRGIKPDSP